MDGDIVLRLLELAEPGTSFEDVGGRRILRDAADEILAARACAEMMLQGTGQKICESMAMRVLYRQWIPVEERLPELGEPVLACWSRQKIGMGVAVRRDWCGKVAWRKVDQVEELDEPIAWMPLPEPPEVK